MTIKADENYNENDCVSIAFCELCVYHEGYYDDSTIACRRTGHLTSLAMVRPANYLKGFKNGEVIVSCLRKEPV